MKILCNREEAEEVSQDTFLKVYEKLDTFKKEAKFSTWLFRIAYNLSISQQRKPRVKLVDTDQDNIESYSEDTLIESFYQESEEHRAVNLKMAIPQLEAEQQLLLQLYYDQDLSIKEIAGITELSASNVKVKIHRARKKLFTLMQTDLSEQTKTA